MDVLALAKAGVDQLQPLYVAVAALTGQHADACASRVSSPGHA